MAWFDKNWHGSIAVEVKIKGNKMSEHQNAALLQVQKGSFKHKIADTGRRNPFDFFILKRANAFLVICEDLKCQVFPFNEEIKPFFIEI